MRRFNLKVPSTCFGVDTEILRPINCWPNKDDYKVAAKSLAEKFVKNFKRYESGVPPEVIKIGGPNLDFWWEIKPQERINAWSFSEEHVFGLQRLTNFYILTSNILF